MTDRDPLAEAFALELAQAERLIAAQVDRSADRAHLRGTQAESPDANAPSEVPDGPDRGASRAGPDPLPDVPSLSGPDPLALDFPFVPGADLGRPSREEAFPMPAQIKPDCSAFVDPIFAGCILSLAMPAGTILVGMVQTDGWVRLDVEG